MSWIGSARSWFSVTAQRFLRFGLRHLALFIVVVGAIVFVLFGSFPRSVKAVPAVVPSSGYLIRQYNGGKLVGQWTSRWRMCFSSVDAGYFVPDGGTDRIWLSTDGIQVIPLADMDKNEVIDDNAQAVD